MRRRVPIRSIGIAAATRASTRKPDGKGGSQSARVLRWDVQNGMDGVAEVTPGPAAYTFHTTEKGRQWDTSTVGDTRPTWGASKTKRSDVLLLPSAPYPGAYTPQQNVDGSHPTIEARAEHNADMGWGVNFVSKHLRQLGENIKEWMSMFGLN